MRNQSTTIAPDMVQAEEPALMNTINLGEHVVRLARLATAMHMNAAGMALLDDSRIAENTERQS